jgi:hypothetical protein
MVVVAGHSSTCTLREAFGCHPSGLAGYRRWTPGHGVRGCKVGIRAHVRPPRTQPGPRHPFRPSPGPAVGIVGAEVGAGLVENLRCALPPDGCLPEHCRHCMPIGPRKLLALKAEGQEGGRRLTSVRLRLPSVGRTGTNWRLLGRTFAGWAATIAITGLLSAALFAQVMRPRLSGGMRRAPVAIAGLRMQVFAGRP